MFMLNANAKKDLQILIVDDEESILTMLTNALGRLYSVKSSKNIADAVAILETHNVDILITDLKLAGENGLELAKIARENDPDIEIVFITGYASFENARIALDFGMVAYMTKPIDLMELFSVVEKALHTRRFNKKTQVYSHSITHGVAELEKHIKQIVSVHNLLQRMNQAIDIQDTVCFLLNEVQKLTNANVVILGVNCLDYTDIYAYSSKAIISQSTVIHLLTSFWKREMARTRLSLLNIRDNNYPITLFNEGGTKPLSPHNNSCTLTTSISIFGEEIGFISAYHHVNTDIDEDNESSFYILPPLVAPALYRGYLERKSRHLAQTDGLTGVANRRSFHEQLNKEITRAVRSKGNLSFLMMDIDFFKKINDTYGHMVGDDVLRKLVEVTSSTIRNYDFLSRFGGEEFAIILPDSNIEGATSLAERIRNAIEKTCVVVADSNIKFTVSIGVSALSGETIEYTPGSNNILKQAAEKLIKNSDDAMYAAKQNGRNRIYYFDEKTNAPAFYQKKNN